MAEEVADLLGEPADSILRISGKTARGSRTVLEELVAKARRRAATRRQPRALIFDSEFDQYRGVIALHPRRRRRLQEGRGDPPMAAGTEADIDDIGFFSPGMRSADELHAGEVGFLVAGIKDVTSCASATR